MSDRHTGLCTYVLRTYVGTLISGANLEGTTFSRDEAAVWLWTPEESSIRAAELTDRLKWAGSLKAERARP